MGSIFLLNCARECAPCGRYTGYVDGFGEKYFSFWVEIFSFYQKKKIFSPFVKSIDLTSWRP